MSLHTRHCQGSCDPSSCAIFMLNPHWGRAATGKTKSLVSMHEGLLPSYPTLCNPVDCVQPGLFVRGVLQAKIGSVLTNTTCHTLLEHNISCCPSHQLPWVPGAARTPATQAAAPSPHLALTNADPILQGSLRSNPSGWPIWRGWIKTTIETQVQCGKGRKPKIFPPAVQAAD